MRFTIGALAALLVAVSAIPTPDGNAVVAREAHEVHHHHYHADGTEMTAAQVKNMKREVAGMDVALEAVTWKEGAKAGPDVNGKFYCMGPHGWKNYCGP